MNDLRVFRDRQRAQQALADSSRDRNYDCSAARLLTTTTVTTYPSSAGSFFACNPTEINGAETEGGAASYVADTTSVVYALNIGSQVPPDGTRVVGHAAGGRYVFRYDG
jgi:hypothetical protein